MATNKPDAKKTPDADAKKKRTKKNRPLPDGIGGRMKGMGIEIEIPEEFLGDTGTKADKRSALAVNMVEALSSWAENLRAQRESYREEIERKKYEELRRKFE